MSKCHIVATIVEDLKRVVEGLPEGGIAQCKMPVDDYPSSVLGTLLGEIEDCLVSSYVDVRIHIAKQAVDRFDAAVITDVERRHPEWIDKKGNLTFYRNELASNQKNGKGKSLLMLIGTDLISDKSSVEHFRDYGIDNLWKEVMGRSFEKWLPSSLSIAEKKSCNSFLRLVMRKTDLNEIDAYLQSLSDDPICFWENLTGNLDRIGLCRLVDVPRSSVSTGKGKRNPDFVLSRLVSLLNTSVDPESNNKTRVERLREEVLNCSSPDDFRQNPKLKFLADFSSTRFGDFPDPVAYLDAVLDVMNKGRQSEIADALKRCDGYTLVYNVLGYKETKGPRPKAEVQVEGMPHIAVCQALWDGIARFVDSDDCGPVEAIDIKPVELVYNITEKEAEENDAGMTKDIFLYMKYVAPSFAGIGECFDSNLFSGLFSDEEGNDDRWSELFANTTVNLELGEEKAYSDVTFTSKTAQIPCLHFEIIFTLENGSVLPALKYRWKQRPDEPTVYSHQLAQKAADLIDDASQEFIPIFYLQEGYDELFLKDENSVIDLLNSKIQAINVYKLGLSTSTFGDEYYGLLLNMDKAFQDFINGFYKTNAQESGSIYSVINSSCADNFITAYKNLFSGTTKAITDKDSSFACSLYKSFWVLDSKQVLNIDMMTTPGFVNGIITILHPAMVELMKKQIVFFLDQFNANVRKLVDGEIDKSTSVWARMVDFAKMNSPISCILGNQKTLSTEWSGNDLFFRVGPQSVGGDDNTPLSVLLKQKDEEGEVIPDTAFTKVTEESRLIRRILRDYYFTYGHGYDSLKVSVFFPSNVQPVFNAVFMHLVGIASTIDSRPDWRALYKRYPLEVCVMFYFDTASELRLSSWISKFNEYFEAQKTRDDKLTLVNLTVGFKTLDTSMLSSAPNRFMGNFKGLVSRNGGSDISILYEVDGSGVSVKSTTFGEMPKFDESKISLAFPMLDKNLPKQDTAKSKRCSLISNRQFVLNSAFMRYSRLLQLNADPELEFPDVIVKDEITLDVWQKMLEECLENSERVLAIGPDIDKELVCQGKDTVIVGFGSGVGSNANLNYAVASRVMSSDVLKSGLGKRFEAAFGIHDKALLKDIIDNLYLESRRMADLSLVRTIGDHGYYMNDFFGYSMIRHMLNVDKEEGDFCDVLLSLDSYRHWIGIETSDNTRADLVWVVANPDFADKRFKIKIVVIESKVSEDIIANNHLDKAKYQVDKTLAELVPRFRPAIGMGCSVVRDNLGNVVPLAKFANMIGANVDTNACDGRYWWMQLYRVISSNSSISARQEADMIQVFENLAEGSFDIEWEQLVMCFDKTMVAAEDVVVRDVYGSDTAASKKSKVCNRLYENGWQTRAFIFTSTAIKKYMAMPNTGMSWNAFKSAIDSNSYVSSYASSVEAALKLINKENDEYADRMNGTYKAAELLEALGDYEEVIDTYSPAPADESDTDPLDTMIEVSDTSADAKTTIEEYKEISTSESRPFNVVPAEEAIVESSQSNISDQPRNNEDDVEDAGSQVRSSNPLLPDAKILLGHELYGAHKPVYWLYGTNYKLPNRHIFIIGSSGNGKSYALQTILAELARIDEGSLIIDYTDGFLGNSLEPEFKKYVNSDKERYLVNEKLAINPFKRHVDVMEKSDGTPLEVTMSNADVAEKVASIFKRECPDLGPVQIGIIRTAIEDGLDAHGEDFDLRMLADVLMARASQSKSEANNISRIMDRLSPLCRLNPFKTNGDEETSWEDFFTAKESHKAVSIIQLARIDSKDAQKAIVEFVLWDLWYYMTPARSNKNTPHMIVLDEIQSLNLDGDSPVIKYLTEGRKRGLTLIAATQSYAGISSKYFQSALENASTKLFFKPTDSDTQAVAKILGRIDSRYSDREWAERLSRLGRGECVAVTSDEAGWTRTALIKVPSFAERGL